MDSPTGFIPEELMNAQSLVAVRAFIMNAALPGYIKREYFFAWARTVGVRLTQADVLMVENSGI
jgi:hypothetical protein